MTNSRTNLTLVLLILICALPMVLSFYLYSNRENIRLTHNNYGTLISPPLLLKSTHLEKRWLILVATHDCKTSDKVLTSEFRNIPLALGKDYYRVNILKSDPCQNSFANTIIPSLITATQAGKIFLVDPNGYIFMSYDTHADPLNILKDLKKVLEVSQIG